MQELYWRFTAFMDGSRGHVPFDMESAGAHVQTELCQMSALTARVVTKPLRDDYEIDLGVVLGLFVSKRSLSAELPSALQKGLAEVQNQGKATRRCVTRIVCGSYNRKAQFYDFSMAWRLSANVMYGFGWVQVSIVPVADHRCLTKVGLSFGST
eukprot:2228888-Amphidinium_carterae.1